MMNGLKKLKSVVFSLAIVLLSISGCSYMNRLPFLATTTPYPTYTPFPTLTSYPTLTPYPTYTPAPATPTPIAVSWDVKVLSSEKNLVFGNWSYTADQGYEFLIVTVQYTNTGTETAELFPMSVLLLLPDGSSYPGYAVVTGDYQPESSNIVTNFTTEMPVIYYIKPGETRTEKFGWSIGTTATETQLVLLFPQTQPVSFDVNQ